MRLGALEILILAAIVYGFVTILRNFFLKKS